MCEPTDLGTTIICCAGSTRTYYVWAHLSGLGEVTGIYYGISRDLKMAILIERRDLDTDTRQKIWRFAEDYTTAEMLIEPFGADFSERNNVVTLIGRH